MRRLERDAVVNGKMTKASNRRVRTPPRALFLFFFGGRPQLVVELDHLCEVNNMYSAQVGIIVSCSVQGKSPKRQLHRTPIAVSGSAYTGN